MGRLSEYEGWEEDSSRRVPDAHVVVHPPSEPCAWSQGERTSAWETACGGAFLFTVGGPAENGPCCGRPLEVSGQALDTPETRA